MVETLPSSTFSLILNLSAATLVTVGLSSLIKFNVTSVTSVVALTNVPIVIIIVSFSSTSVSSLPFVDMVIEPDDLPADIVIGLSDIVYSVSLVAVPETVNGIDTSLPDTFDTVAVNLTSVDEFSSISSELNAKLTVGGSSSSVIVIVIGSVFVLVAFTGV